MNAGIICCLLLAVTTAAAQEEHGVLNLQEELLVESLANDDAPEIDDDGFLLAMADFRRHPVSLNRADADGLKELRILTDIQIQSLIRYRMLFGRLISIYELQAVPGWDLATIGRLRPYITIHEPGQVLAHIRERLKGGQSSLMLRTSLVPQQSEGYIKNDSGIAKYKGSPARVMFRYQYNYKNLLQYGLLGDKDAGEGFFKGVQKAGFDFYSYYVFVRKLGALKALALGDYTVSMGQGLIHWQGSGMRKNADAMLIKRQGEVLKPYRSAGEYNFQRGAGITVQKKRWTITGFLSYRKYSASMDTDANGSFVSSIVTSGYHRTALEQQKRKNLQAFSGGMVARYAFNGGNISANTVHYRFAVPLHPQPKPYDLYGIKGNIWSNYSIDFEYTFRNMHTYGELAADRHGNIAFMQGAMITLHRKIDFSVVYRNLTASYQSMAGGSFTENSVPTNEKGLYAGIVFRPRTGWAVNLYTDIFRSRWVRFTTDAPAAGSGYLLQIV
ncbi:MAG: helix-hairpin-helix domain-containing protein, partial [Sphingobacteriales bacterium]